MRYNLIRDHESLRPLQDRRRPLEFAHHGAHARGLPLCARAGSRGLLDRVARVQTDLYGSLALTGLGHATDRAVCSALRQRAGHHRSRGHCIHRRRIRARGASISPERMPFHSTSRATSLPSRPDVSSRRAHAASQRTPLTAFDAAGAIIAQRTFFSIGGGFITEDGEADRSVLRGATSKAAIPFPFHSAAELLATAHANELSISQLMLENECALASPRFGARRRSKSCAKASSASGRPCRTASSAASRRKAFCPAA
jgi:L-serine dehydratase